MQIENMYLSHNRPGTIRSKTTAIAVHWVGNPGTSAKANRNYFQNTDRSVSSNYIVGLDGEIICCIPDNEVSWCTNQANSYTVSIETCHPDCTGKFNDKTYKSLVELTAHLCKKYGLNPKNGGIIRHFDVTRKVCPKWFVPKKYGGTDTDSGANWEKFKTDVYKNMNGGSIEKSNLYRVRKSWTDEKSQIGAYNSLDNAKKACKDGYTVYDEKGNIVYTKSKLHGHGVASTSKIKAGYKIQLNKMELFVSSDTTKCSNILTGFYYVTDGKIVNGRFRISAKPGGAVTGWIDKKYTNETG